MQSYSDRHRVRTGLPRADQILDGGLVPESGTLVRGAPGAGKTILGLHFLAADSASGNDALYINLGEPASYLKKTAESFGLDIGTVEFLDLSPSGEEFQSESTYDLFHSGEVETPSLVTAIRDRIEAIEPNRVVIDPVTVIRHLSPDERQFRTQVLSLLDFLKAEGATVLLTSQAAPSIPDDDLQFLADTVINLNLDADHRTLEVSKFRGSAARPGPHTVTIGDDGMRVWPQLDPTRHQRDGARNERKAGAGTSKTLSSGVSELDSLLEGGLTTGTITFLSGPTGVGKTTTGLQFMKEAAKNGGRSVVYSFEESSKTMLERAESVGIPVGEMIEEGTLVIEEIGPDELSMDEFTHRLRTEIEESRTEIVMIDGISGYERAFQETGVDTTRRLIKIGRYLRNMNVTGLVTNEVHRITGEFQATEQKVSHLADAIIVLRHVEYRGELRKVIGVLKMRTSDFENGIRLMDITENGLEIGEPLSDLRGILTGTPERKEREK